MLVVFVLSAFTLTVALPVPFVMPFAVTVKLGMAVSTVAVVAPEPLAVTLVVVPLHMSRI